MNIDIVNNKISKQLGIPEKKIKLVNDFYWKTVYDNFYSYTEKPINIENVCVFYPNCYFLKKEIILNLNKIRKLKKANFVNKDSVMRKNMIENYKIIIKKLWKIRKLNKHTN